jgi:hypothetical protein
MLHMVKLICFDRVINLCHTLVVDISGMELGSRSSCKICYYIYIYLSFTTVFMRYHQRFFNLVVGGCRRHSSRGFDPWLGVKKSHSSISLKAHGKGLTIGHLGCGLLCMDG